MPRRHPAGMSRNHGSMTDYSVRHLPSAETFNGKKAQQIGDFTITEIMSATAVFED